MIQAMGGVYLCSKVRRTSLGKACRPASLRPRLAAFREIARQGIPASANLFTIGLGIFVITYYASGFGKEAVAAYGAAIRIEQIVLLPTIGLSTATLAIVAQNSGAGLLSRINETVRTANSRRSIPFNATTAADRIIALLIAQPTVTSRPGPIYLMKLEIGGLR